MFVEVSASTWNTRCHSPPAPWLTCACHAPPGPGQGGLSRQASTWLGLRRKCWWASCSHDRTWHACCQMRLDQCSNLHPIFLYYQEITWKFLKLQFLSSSDPHIDSLVGNDMWMNPSSSFLSCSIRLNYNTYYTKTTENRNFIFD